ncbi:hypothetical protein EU528_00620 [Candidatus Thorarchaeota archaeon]|nr:MAG: hypothetical protein EU528_00620 [Candidatus Thorarchaeota archaeon]
MTSSFLVWFLAISLLFDYIVNVLHPDQAFGEPIWVIAPIGFFLISIPTGLVFFAGFVAIFWEMSSKE